MFEKYVDLININGITLEIIEQIISDHANKRKDTLEKYGRYKQTEKDVPIFERTFEIETANKINNKLANDWFSEIIDTKVGYLFGKPVIYQVEKHIENYDLVTAAVERFKKINNIDDLNGEWCKFMGMCGYDAGLLYFDKEGQERVMRVDPWEACIISKTEINEPEYALRYYQTHDDKWRVDFYDGYNRTTFEGKELNKVNLIQVEKKPHGFDYCPLFGLPNNAELIGDADKVLSLIDGYDRAMSDMNSEIEQFRLAYMLFIGYAPDDAALERMRKTGALYIPTAEDGEDIRFLTKQMDHGFIDSHLDRIEKNIERFAKHVNFSEAFGGGQVTGPAMRYKLFALESKSTITERKHEAAQMHMIKTLGTAWRKRGINIDYTAVDCKYTRNIPVNIVDEANAANALLSVTSLRTALEQLSFVSDVEAEIDRIMLEKEEFGNIDLDDERLKAKDDKDNNGDTGE